MKSRTKRQRAKVAGRRVEARAAGAEQKPSLRGRRFTVAQRLHALTLIASAMKREQVAEVVGTTTESLRRWAAEARAKGTMPAGPAGQPAATETKAAAGTAQRPAVARVPRSPYAPADPAQGLGEHEVAAILELKRSHPSMGPAQLRAQLKRFNTDFRRPDNRHET